MSRIEMAILLRLASSKERMTPSTIGYCLIGSGDIVPRREKPNAQGAALMVVRPLHHLERMKMIDYWDREGEQRGYAITQTGRHALLSLEANPVGGTQS
ncbi:hypothetical protein QYG06_17895 [Xanthomonas euvesicatoria]|uniref:PadR family transcriptional regulator n=4 Tax=Xanthomonas TaxID=338 RepID=A0AB73H393_9XANT|nr:MULTISPECIES: hypothetical protein [Xanthomonas]MBB5672859.1 hypothetical protein [Xanthomonas arboricola]MCC8581738.1 hypothetical protein [Xanthomonas euvesicatoria pv. euvesicatoria]MCC8586238.1 hypothetical protein [Xanthomonas euvesicatoria pv. euvesicatoria]MCC8590673.1 hypothetical protein [Xanthomonas euvesicatoria pv. euvesicatoria]MCC8595038.1 hypothetical protein [Xanthomonas euvesicatoria pv. euvesicatoria]